MTKFRNAVYTELTKYLDASKSITNATFQTSVNSRIRQLKSHLLKKEYACIKDLTKLFLSTNPLPSLDRDAHLSNKYKAKLGDILSEPKKVKNDNLDTENFSQRLQ